MTPRKAVLGVLVATVVGLLAACGVTWGGSPTPDLRATAARQYQAATAKADTATKAFDVAVGKLPNDASYSDVVPAARALLAAMTSFKDTVFPDCVSCQHESGSEVIRHRDHLDATGAS